VTAASPSLDGRAAIVTGAGGFIGRAIAHALAGRGARIAVADCDAARADEACEALRAAGASALPVVVDVSEEAQVASLVARTVEAFGRLDVLVNAAAELRPEIALRDVDVVSMDQAVWDRVMAVNLRGPMFACKHAIPAMAGHPGSIVNVASVQALDGYSFLTAYGVSKAALVALTKYVATRHGRDGVRCNAVAPGLIPHAGLRRNFSQELIDGVLRHNLVPHHGDVEDVARAVAYLAGDESRFVTGQLLVVDGGYTTHSPSYAETSPEGTGPR